MAVVRQHHLKALTPTWFLVKATPAPAPREGGKKTASSPLLLSPAVWQMAQQDEKKKRRNKDGDDPERADGGLPLPASPRISCMGQVKGRRKSRGCSSARGGSGSGPGPAPPRGRGRGSGYHRDAGGMVASLVLGLFGMTMRRGNARRASASSRACAKVRDVPRGTAAAAAASAPGSTRGGVRRGVAVAAVSVFDPPLPVVVRRPATDDDAPSLWERRRGGRALEGLQLT